MKKMITTLTLLAFLAVGAYSQTSAPVDKGFKPGIGYPDCPEMGRKDFSRNNHYRDGKFGKRDHEFGPRMIEMLNLTDEQVEKMHKIKIKYDKMEIDVKAEQKKLGIDKKEAMKNMEFDKAKKITKQMSELRTKHQIMNIDQKEEFSKILNKEQIEKMKKFHPMGNKGGRRDGKKGKGFNK